MFFSLPIVLSVTTIMFVFGLYIVMVRKNMIAILIGVELILNAAAVNFAAFSHFSSASGGREMILFIIALAALEAVVAMAIILSIYKQYGTTSIDNASAMKE